MITRTFPPSLNNLSISFKVLTFCFILAALSPSIIYFLLNVYNSGQENIEAWKEIYGM